MSWPGEYGVVGATLSNWRIVCARLVAGAIGVSIYFLPVMRLLDAIAE
jgi:hypothetical protein